MKRKVIKFVLISTIAAVTCTSLHEEKTLSERLTSSGVSVSDTAPCMLMYNSIVKYSEEYDIPKEYAFALAYQETRYKGPIDTMYKFSVKSSAGALGPMQIMYSTAKHYIHKDETLTKSLLKSNIDLNVKLSMRILRDLKDTYGTWGKAFGAYNTGKPVINTYSRKILKKSYDWIGFSMPGAYLL
jgi:soluble lytic murein transglycosylase-like protein